MTFYPLERLMNLSEGYRRTFMINGKPLLLVHNEGRNYLMLNQCPHQQSPLSNATVSTGMIRCPLHGMSFDLQTGRSTDGCQQLLQFFPVAFEGNQLGVFL